MHNCYLFQSLRKFNPYFLCTQRMNLVIAWAGSICLEILASQQTWSGGLIKWLGFTESHSFLNYRLGKLMFTYLLKYYMDYLTEEEHTFWSPTVCIISSWHLVLDYFSLERALFFICQDCLFYNLPFITSIIWKV